jgi:hypothetical protein
MGQGISCDCLEQAITGEDKEFMLRVETLRKGQKFMRSSFLGMMGQREVFLTLTEDNSRVQWKANKTTFSSEEIGEIDMTTIKTVKLSGISNMQFIGGEGDKSGVVFEVSSEDPKTRDLWVIALNEIIQDWASHPDKKPRSQISAAGTSNKNEYFSKRQEEIKEREAAAKEMKKKYLTGGMKYTAIAMANRQS